MQTATLLETTVTREPTNGEIDDAGAMLLRIEAARIRNASLREECRDYDTWEAAFGWDGLPPRRSRGGF